MIPIFMIILFCNNNNNNNIKWIVIKQLDSIYTLEDQKSSNFHVHDDDQWKKFHSTNQSFYKITNSERMILTIIQ